MTFSVTRWHRLVSTPTMSMRMPRQEERGPSGLTACLKALRRGDTLVVWKLDRLGRDLRHLVNLVDDLTQRHIGLKVLAGEGASIDTSTANGRLMFGIFAALAEFERALIIERTKAGLAAARARGRNGGAPFKPARSCALLQQQWGSRKPRWPIFAPNSVSHDRRSTGLSILRARCAP